MRKKYNYETDGIVFKANNCKEQHYLGETSHHPRFALAYKYQGISAQTKLIKVIWSISRIGVITPICLVVPVFILGANINKISIFNIQKFQKLKLKKETLFEISRKGGIIPYIDRVLYSYGDSLNIVEKCPSCKEQTVIKGNFLFCSIADKCISVLEARILFFCRAIRLYGFGKQLIRKLIVNKFIKKPIDIYRLNKIKLLSLNGINTVLANKLLQSVKRRRTLFLSTFLFALDFKKVGKTVTKIVVNHFGSLSKIRNANRDTLTKLNGIGAIIADAYVVGLKKHSKDIDELLLFVSLIKDKKTN
jgi:DNA ligase (NAD+)